MNSNLIWKQIQMLWCDLRDPKTGGTLLQAITKIWRLLIQLFLIVLLVVLLAIAGIVWFWGVAYQTGRDDRQWLDQHPEADNNTFAMYVISKNILAPFKWLVTLSHEVIYAVLGIKPKSDLLSTSSESKQLAASPTAPVTALTTSATTRVGA